MGRGLWEQTTPESHDARWQKKKGRKKKECRKKRYFWALYIESAGIDELFSTLDGHVRLRRPRRRHQAHGEDEMRIVYGEMRAVGQLGPSLSALCKDLLLSLAVPSLTALLRGSNVPSCQAGAKTAGGAALQASDYSSSASLSSQAVGTCRERRKVPHHSLVATFLLWSWGFPNIWCDRSLGLRLPYVSVSFVEMPPAGPNDGRHLPIGLTSSPGNDLVLSRLKPQQHEIQCFDDQFMIMPYPRQDRTTSVSG